MRRVVIGLASVLRDARYGARLLTRSPWFSLVAIASLAVAIGTGVGLFTFMNALLFRPLPGRQTADIHRLFTSSRNGGRHGASSFADYQAFGNTPGLFSASCATTNVRGTVVASGQPHALPGALMSGGCFEALRLRAHAGRLLAPADERSPDAPAPVVISHAWWRQALGGDVAVVGQAITLNGASAVIAGIAEPGFAGLSLEAGAAFWAPASLAPVLIASDALTSRDSRRFAIFVRLGEGVSAAQAAERLKATAAQLRIEDPVAWTDARGETRTISIAREIDTRFGREGVGREVAIATIGAVAGLVAIACVNLATMLMARGAARSRELGIRLALGASPSRLLRQLGTESLLISAGGGAAGLLLVATALRLFDVYRPLDVPGFNLDLDWRVAGFALVLALVAPIAFGVAPGVHALRLARREGTLGRPLTTRRRRLPAGPRELLIVAQVSVSFACLIAAALFTRSLVPAAAGLEAAATPPVTVWPIDVSTAAQTNAARRLLADRLLEAADRVPGVSSATLAAMIPLTGSYMEFPGRADDRPDDAVIEFDGNIVGPEYFAIAGIDRRAGRSFSRGDRDGAPQVAIVSESLARQLWRTNMVVGRGIRLEDGSREIVGVVADAPYRSRDATPQPVLYLPIGQAPRTRMVLHARVGASAEAIAALDRAIRSIDARIEVGAAMTMAQVHDRARAPARVAQWSGSVAGLLQMALALMATWGLVAYAVERRAPEIAIRRALGATEAGILGLVMAPSLWLLAIGAVIGGAGGILVARVMHASFIGLAPIDYRLVIPAAGLLAGVVVAAAWLPARRATRAEPASVLKQA